MLDPEALRIVHWLREIGLSVRFASVPADSFLPGVALEPGGLVIDAERLLYPGDLLHEAGHLAVMLPAQRAAATSTAEAEQGDEIAAQTWSFAAAVHLGIAPEMVFHAKGYKGASQTLIDTYAHGRAGVPLLQWMGLTLNAKNAAARSAHAYPMMLRWLRQNPDDT